MDTIAVAIGFLFINLYAVIVYAGYKKKTHKAYLREVEAQEDSCKSLVRDKTKSKSIQPGNQGYQPRKTIRPTEMPVKSNIKQDIDKLKRKNIQPGNIGLVPVGAIQDHNGNLRASNINKKQNIEHKFFGTQLELGGRVLINGLPKALHKLEVVEGELYVDGKTVKVHPNDVDALIKQIKESK